LFAIAINLFTFTLVINQSNHTYKATFATERTSPMAMPTVFPAVNTSSPFASWKGDHGGIRVPDFDAAVAWYTEKLDFRVMHSWPYGEITFAFISPAVDDSFRLELVAGPGAADRPTYENLGDSLALLGWHHLCLRVDSIDGTVEELKRRGVTIVSEPLDVPSISRRFAFFADPWGNLFELTETIGASRQRAEPTATCVVCSKPTDRSWPTVVGPSEDRYRAAAVFPHQPQDSLTR
jgi:catechol 2,3-dioxygenase-like lactoylglutathione lyase family enzyme